MGEGLLGFFRKYGQAGLDKLEELKAQGQGYASQVDEYFGITPKPDPSTLPPRPTADRGPFAGPEQSILRDNPLMEALGVRKPDQPIPIDPNAPRGGISLPSGFSDPSKIFSSEWTRHEKPILGLYEDAIKRAHPMGSMNAVNPLPIEQNRAAIRAKLPGVQGEVATGGFPAQGMQSGIGRTQTPLGGIPGAEFRDPATFPQQSQAQPRLFPDGRPMPLGAGVGGVVDAQRAKQQQMQQAQQQEKIKQQQMDKSGRFGMSGYFDKLFNDPSRMAMLQGGLSMMDPSSYYDAQGFGSPWTGLRAGMGAAGKGYQGVKKQQMEERKSESEIALAGAKTLKNMNALEIDNIMSRSKYSSVVKGHYIDKYQIAVDMENGMSQEDAVKKNSFRFGDDAYQMKMLEANRKTDASIAQIESILNTPGVIDWNTVGIPGSFKEGFEALASWTGMDTDMRASKLRLTADWIQSMAWRDLVGSGQLSVADYNRLQTMLGTRGWTDTPELVKMKYQEALSFLKNSRKGAGFYLQQNIGKAPKGGAPDLSGLGGGAGTWSPEDQNISDLYNMD